MNLKNIKISILFQNKDILVINKPSGLVVHPAVPAGKTETDEHQYSLVNWILEHFPEMAGVGEPLELEYKGEKVSIDRPGIVHRLDRETSGVMILTKNQKTYDHIKSQFQNHTIRKEYIAIVSGYTDDRGIIDEPIGRSSRDIRRWVTGQSARGTLRTAVTRYVTEKKFIDREGNKFSLVRLFPETGRTHQLRVHMKSIQHPIIGDGLYAPKTVGLLGCNRVMLHAHKIIFQGLDGKETVIETPIPDEFLEILDK